MPESGPQEGHELTPAEWRAAVTVLGWILEFHVRGAAIVPVPMPPRKKREEYLPAALNNQLTRLTPLLMAETFGERDEEGFRHCPKCYGTYSAKLWQDVAAMCGNNLCPLRSVK